MSELPETMRSLAALKYCRPSEIEVIDMPLPRVEKPDQVLIRIHACGLLTGDMQRVKGDLAVLLPMKQRFPMKIGGEGSGVIVAIGTEVKRFRPGDEVYAMDVGGRPFDFTHNPGLASQYAVCSEDIVVSRPSHISFEDAASLPGCTVTAYQCIERGLELLRENGVTDGLKGKTAFVPGALSSTGSIMIQLLRNEYGVKRIISTVSTAKLPLVEQYLPGYVDQLVDYTVHKQLTDAIPAGSVDLVLNTQWDLFKTFPLVNPKKGVVISIASLPHPALLREMIPNLPFFVFWLLSAAQWYYAFKLRGTNVKYEFVSGNFGPRETVDKVGEFIAIGKVNAVTRTVDLEDLEAVRKACDQVATGKGGIGKLVVTCHLTSFRTKS
ncbi:alcohol dehydrogenase [Xylariaceae sp. FL1272]|nr:alcohol dehydrogenase [Xylariaceae sp. FL1272]